MKHAKHLPRSRSNLFLILGGEPSQVTLTGAGGGARVRGTPGSTGGRFRGSSGGARTWGTTTIMTTGLGGGREKAISEISPALTDIYSPVHAQEEAPVINT